MDTIRPAEISDLLKKQIAGFQTSTDLEEVGTVLQVGDGIARVHGLENVKSNELSHIMGRFSTSALGTVGFFLQSAARKTNTLRSRAKAVFLYVIICSSNNIFAQTCDAVKLWPFSSSLVGRYHMYSG